MKDTPPALDARYRAMLLARSGEERLRMAGSMYATARALVIASILEADPSASPAALRQALFLRFYGHELDQPTRARVLARLAADAERDPARREPQAASREPAPPGRRRVPIDWDALELALSWRMDESESVLDLRTGEVRQCRLSAFASDAEDFELSEDEADAGLAEGYLVRIEPLPSAVEWDWMAEFAASVTDSRLHDRLERALRGRGAFRRFKDVLADHPPERERWFRFHDERVREAMRDWLEEHDIEPTAGPPERTR